MNVAQLRFYAINQLLCGKKLSELPENVQDVVSSVGLEGTWKKVLELPKQKFTDTERLFINLFRVQGYNGCLVSEDTVASFDDIVYLVHNGQLNVEHARKWAPYAISSVESDPKMGLCCVDGKLFVPKEYAEEVPNFMDIIGNSFEYRCFGTLSPTSTQVKALAKILDFLNAKDEISMTDTLFKGVFSALVKLGVHPDTLRSTCLEVHDLSYVTPICGALLWWAEPSHSAVVVVIPKGGDTSTKLSIVGLDYKSLILAIGGDMTKLDRLSIKSGKVSIKN